LQYNIRLFRLTLCKKSKKGETSEKFEVQCSKFKVYLVGLVYLVCFVGLVGLVYLVCFVGLVGLVCFVGLVDLVCFVYLVGFVCMCSRFNVLCSRFGVRGLGVQNIHELFCFNPLGSLFG
jgi:hypothetical protein